MKTTIILIGFTVLFAILWVTTTSSSSSSSPMSPSLTPGETTFTTPALRDAITTMDQKAMNLLNECEYAVTGEDFYRCIDGIRSAIEYCDEYPSLEICKANDRREDLLQRAENYLKSKK